MIWSKKDILWIGPVAALFAVLPLLLPKIGSSIRVYVLGGGRIVFHGTPGELEARADIKKEHMGV